MEETGSKATATNTPVTAPVTAPVKHNAKFTKNILHAIGREIHKEWENRPEETFDDGEYMMEVLDPFGGIGGIFAIREHAHSANLSITCIELEKEWAIQGYDNPYYVGECVDRIIVGDFLKWATPAHKFLFDIVVTSPTYGNRMADHHDATDDSKRNTYKHTLGRDLSPGSSAVMQWTDDEYRDFHIDAWSRVYDLLVPGGLFLLNVKDHIRKKKRQPVSTWHRTTCVRLGFELVGTLDIGVKGNRQGENHEARVDDEQVHMLRKPFANNLPFRNQQFPQLRAVK